MVENSNLVEFRGVSYSIDGFVILDDLNLTIEKGEVLVLLGESGCGKTTTLKLINRLIEPTSGEVLVEGKSTADWNAIALRRHIGYVIQDGGLFPHFTVAENVALVLRLEKWDESRQMARTSEMLDLVGLDPAKFASRYPHELSGGQRQRVLIAMALLLHPALVIADEPTSALDMTVQAQILGLLRELQRETGTAVLFVTHDFGVVAEMCSRVLVMQSGRIVEDAPVDRAFHSPAHAHTAALIRAVPTLTAHR